MGKPTERSARSNIQIDDRVRHISTGDLGTYHGVERADPWSEWALVRWDDDGPGMVDNRGLSRVSLGALERVAS